MFISNRRTYSLAVLAGITALVAAQPATAEVVNSDLGVSATVTSNCVVSTTPIAFGDVDVTSGSAVDATGGLGLTCTNGTAWAASAGVGLGASATLLQRKMSNGAEVLNYALYTDSNRTSVWGDGVTGTSTMNGTGSGSAQSRVIYGRVPTGQPAVLAGEYADTVTVTLTY